MVPLKAYRRVLKNNPIPSLSSLFCYHPFFHSQQIIFYLAVLPIINNEILDSSATTIDLITAPFRMAGLCFVCLAACCNVYLFIVIL